jgi:hypothetical protein
LKLVTLIRFPDFLRRRQRAGVLFPIPNICGKRETVDTL